MNILISTNLNASYTTFKQECLTNSSACCTACNSTQTPALPAQCTLTVHTHSTVHTQAAALDATGHSNCICAPTWNTFKTTTCTACTLKAQCTVCRHKKHILTHSNLRQFITCMFIYSLLDGCIHCTLTLGTLCLDGSAHSNLMFICTHAPLLGHR